MGSFLGPSPWVAAWFSPLDPGPTAHVLPLAVVPDRHARRKFTAILTSLWLHAVLGNIEWPILSLCVTWNWLENVRSNIRKKYPVCTCRLVVSAWRLPLLCFIDSFLLCWTSGWFPSLAFCFSRFLCGICETPLNAASPLSFAPVWWESIAGVPLCWKSRKLPHFLRCIVSLLDLAGCWSRFHMELMQSLDLSSLEELPFVVR